jgi:hypothetical protein
MSPVSLRLNKSSSAVEKTPSNPAEKNSRDKERNDSTSAEEPTSEEDNSDRGANGTTLAETGTSDGMAIPGNPAGPGQLPSLRPHRGLGNPRI